MDEPTPTPAPDAGSTILPPVHGDGTPFRFEVVLMPDEARIYGDSATDLLAQMVPGYTDGAATERLLQRVMHAKRILPRLQADIYASHPAAIALTPDQMRTLLDHRHQPVKVDRWDGQVPLVLLDVDYQPYGDEPAPISGNTMSTRAPNLLWLTPADEVTYLESLHHLGCLILSEHDDHTP